MGFQCRDGPMESLVASSMMTAEPRSITMEIGVSSLGWAGKEEKDG